MNSRFAILAVLTLFGAALAHAQSACPPGYEQLCKHPNAPSQGGGGNGGQRAPQQDSGPSRYDQAAEHVHNARIYQKRYEEAGQEEDLKAAFAEAKTAWDLDQQGSVVIIELCNKIGNTKASKAWAEAALKIKFQDTKSVHMWLKYIIAADNVDIAQEELNGLQIGTGPGGQEPVDTNMSLFQIQARRRELEEKVIPALIKERDKKRAEWQKRIGN